MYCDCVMYGLITLHSSDEESWQFSWHTGTHTNTCGAHTDTHVSCMVCAHWDMVAVDYVCPLLHTWPSCSHRPSVWWSFTTCWPQKVLGYCYQNWTLVSLVHTYHRLTNTSSSFVAASSTNNGPSSQQCRHSVPWATSVLSCVWWRYDVFILL